jgi:hypothetical protein
MSYYFIIHCPNFPRLANETNAERFGRLSRAQNWPRQQFLIERKRYVQEAKNQLGPRLANIQEFQEAIRAINAINGFLVGQPLPVSLNRCRKLLATANINIFDFADGRYFDHGSRAALARYTRRTKLYFPLSEAKDDPVMRSLLKKVRR